MCARVRVSARPLSRAVLSCEWHGPTDDSTTVRGDKRCGRFRKLTHVTSSLFIIMLPLINGGGCNHWPSALASLSSRLERPIDVFCSRQCDIVVPCALVVPIVLLLLGILDICTILYFYRCPACTFVDAFGH
jgi:hypothetical protein